MSSDHPRGVLILDELRRRTEKEKIVDVEEKKVKVVVFTLRNESFAFYGSDVKEIIPMMDIYYVPGAPEHIAGVINLRGDIESVVRIESFLGLGSAETKKSGRIMIAQKNLVRSGIFAESVEDVLDVAVSSIKPPLSTHHADVKNYVAGELFIKGRNITLLDIGRIFSRLS